MAVVINDMETAPQPPAQDAAGQTSASGGSQEKLKQLEKSWHKKRQRIARLEAY